MRLPGQRRDDRCQDSQFFNARHDRQRQEHRVRRCVRVSADRCIQREWRQQDRVRLASVREQEWPRRDLCAPERARELRHAGQGRDMYREA
jgi:hypothetical protein